MVEKQFWIIKIWVLVIIVVSTIFSISLFVFGYRSFALSIFLASLLAAGNLVLAIFVPADDLTDPAPATAFAHLDATTVLSRQIAELGIYPAVDPLDSTSRILDPQYVGEEHYYVARKVQEPEEIARMFREQ